MEFVRETPSGLIFPNNMARKRKNKAKWAISAVTLLLFSVGVFFTKENKMIYLLSSLSTMFSSMCIIEMLVRVCKLYEEVDHFRSRYNNNLKKLLYYTFSFQNSSLIVLLFSITTFIIIFVKESRLPLWIMFDNTAAQMFCIPNILLLNRIYNFEDSPLNESLQIDKLKGIDYGSGMAQSFFHGYLKIVLPNTGTKEKGFLEFLTDYQDKNKISFEVTKLFILIPMSLHCPPRLDSDFSISIERSMELESKEIDRAGVSKRNYKNSVYKIKTISGKKKYVSAEYATPVKTLKEVMAQNTPFSKLYNRHRREITLHFYLTLKELIKNDPDCCNLCEVIYYDDLDKDGKYIDVGSIILKRMKQISQGI